MFGRRRRGGKHAEPAGAPVAPEGEAADIADAAATETVAASEVAADYLVRREDSVRADGPWDETEAAPDVQRVDLGALRVPVAQDLDVQLNLLHEEIVAVSVTHQGSTLQLQAFAAPKSGDLWAEAREEISRELADGGSQPSTVDGPFGSELRAQLPVQTENGAERQSARFVGVDGPRWLVRGVFTGPAGGDPMLGARLRQVLRETVVVRGDAPMPPRERLPLQMPPDAEDYASGEEALGAV